MAQPGHSQLGHLVGRVLYQLSYLATWTTFATSQREVTEKIYQMLAEICYGFNNLTGQVKDELQLITILTAIYLSNNESSKKKHVLLCFSPHVIKSEPRSHGCL